MGTATGVEGLLIQCPALGPAMALATHRTGARSPQIKGSTGEKINGSVVPRSFAVISEAAAGFQRDRAHE